MADLPEFQYCDKQTLQVYEPTPEEIAAACLEIQKGWSELERRKREQGILPGRRRANVAMQAEEWTPPVVSLAELPNGMRTLAASRTHRKRPFI